MVLPQRAGRDILNGLHYLALGLPGVGYNNHIELIPVGWQDLSRQIWSTAATVGTETGVEPLIVGMDRYAIASELAFYGFEQTQGETPTSSAHLFGGIGLMYERWTPGQMQQGRTLLLIAWDSADLTSKSIESHTDRLGPIDHQVLTRDDRVIRQYYYRLAYNYHSIPHPVD